MPTTAAARSDSFNASDALEALEEVQEHLADSMRRDLARLQATGAVSEAREICRSRYDDLLTRVARTMDTVRGMP